MRSLALYLRTRRRLILAAAALGLLLSFCCLESYEPSPKGLIQALSAASGTEVSEFAWEPQGSAPAELLLGRGILFIGRKPGEPQAEVHRAFVHLSIEGRVLGISRLRNLSQTDLADESGLRAHGRHAVFVSEGEGGQAILSVLDTSGEKRRATGLFGRLMLSSSRFLEQGSLAGLGRCDVLLPPDLQTLALQQKDDVLELHLDQRRIELSLKDLFDPTSTDSHDLEVMRRVSKAPPFGHWAADIGRALFGPAAVARIEEFALSLSDRFAKAGYQLTHMSAAEAPVKVPAKESPSTAQTSLGRASWPPPDLPSPWPKPQPGEGHWTSFAADLMPRTAAPHSPSPLYRTFVRPDPDRPYARAELVVADMSRLELGLRGGYEDPRPRTGPPGSGHVPDDPRVYRRIVATFNGAFKTTHGSYGMKAEGRVLVPPTPGAATVRIDPNGAVGLGTHRPEREGSEGLRPLDEAEAYRQNLDLLIEGDRLLPTGRTDWGDHLIGGGIVAERSGLCVRNDGHLVYVWATESTAESLARAMQMAGCTRGMHLDMNPGHCTFAAHQMESFQPLRAHGRLLSPAMKASVTRYLRWSPKDFFYLAYREPFPRSPAANEYSFEAAPGDQPDPGDVPAFVIGRRSVAGIELEVERIDLSRVRLRLESGSGEIATVSGVLEAQPGDDVDQAATGSATELAAFTLGHATHGNRPGMSQGSTSLISFDRRLATLVLPQSGDPSIKLPGDPVEPAPDHDLVQLELLARDGALSSHGRRLTTRRRHGALCIDEGGYLWFGRMTHDTPGPLAQALIELGCEHVLETDRGSQSPASVERKGHEGGVRSSRKESAVVATGRAVRGRAYAF